jgi:pimeloyl-ACP methyl ester carboxylesterase
LSGGASALIGRDSIGIGGCLAGSGSGAARAGYGVGVPANPTPLRPPLVETKTVRVHGHSVSYVEAGSGPLLVLIHGMAGTCENWSAVLEPLALRHTVIAPDFPGHGLSEPGGGDYSLGSLASGLRDLLLALGHERATLVGHSLGGGVALQFTYQFPEMVERLVLVSSGGLGPDVSPVLRAAALPGADLFIAATAEAGRRLGSVVGQGLGMVGLRPSADVAEVLRGYATLADGERRKAFLATLRAVVGTDGQRVAALDRLYLAETLPLLIVWGERDPIIPVAHAEEAHRQLPSSRLEIFEGVGHLPQMEEPGRFIAALERFLAETEPAEFDRAQWRAHFKSV